jgi:hypothetical protein
MPRRTHKRRARPRWIEKGPGIPKGEKRPRGYHRGPNRDADFASAITQLEGGR